MWRQVASAFIWPFYQTQLIAFEIIVNTQILKLLRVLKAIKIEMINHFITQIVWLYQCERWAFDRALMAHAAKNAARQSSFARTQLTLKENHAAASQQLA